MMGGDTGSDAGGWHRRILIYPKCVSIRFSHAATGEDAQIAQALGQTCTDLNAAY